MTDMVLLIGTQITKVCAEIDRLEPGTAPMFLGFTSITGEPRGLFGHDVTVRGYQESLDYAKRLLAETRQRIGQREPSEVVP